MSHPRDVVMVTVDSLRADHCGFMGYHGDTTPYLDSLADDALVFENAVAPAGATNGSTPVFTTGEYPVSRGGESVRDRVSRHLSARETIAERFQRLGYRTAAISANPWVSRYFGYDTGFESFEDFFDDETAEEEGKKRRDNKLSMLSQVASWWQGQDMYMTWEAFYDDIEARLDEARSDDRPYFLWVFLVDAHMPYLPPKGYRSQSVLRSYAGNALLYAGKNPPFDDWFRDTLVTAYDDTIRYTDAFMRRLLRDVGPDGSGEAGEEGPLVLFHADHGEAFGEGDGYGHAKATEEVLHVPMMVLNGPSGRIDAPFSLRHVPDLATGLATDPTFDPAAEFDSPVAMGRTYQPSWAVRGESFIYAETPHETRLKSVAGSGRDLYDDDLRSLCHEIVEWERESTAERERLLEASEVVAEDPAL
jgi:arylsulfatase A-like enzyme